jgi:hypothetical protein
MMLRVEVDGTLAQLNTAKPSFYSLPLVGRVREGGRSGYKLHLAHNSLLSEISRKQSVSRGYPLPQPLPTRGRGVFALG